MTDEYHGIDSVDGRDQLGGDRVAACRIYRFAARGDSVRS
jgi:hypothetical protein